MIEMFFCIFLIASNHIFRTRCIFMVLYLNIVQSWKFLTVFQNKMTITMLYFFLLLRNFFSQWCTLYIDSSSNLLLCFGPEEISMHLYRRAVPSSENDLKEMLWTLCKHSSFLLFTKLAQGCRQCSQVIWSNYFKSF